jgi:hypothetical protein
MENLFSSVPICPHDMLVFGYEVQGTAGTAKNPVPGSFVKE